ncbi:hypothetical protein EDD17DRAFT_1767840 [Pisolithus thermaeus]|nr:hypothetical protein EV401DRAFT_1894364 [Pisolithus croceorrhizus]KAI6145738.1 hypothetical protein EDD17DRAFT_1767840 [Pisolithus thermaeus]
MPMSDLNATIMIDWTTVHHNDLEPLVDDKFEVALAKIDEQTWCQKEWVLLQCYQEEAERHQLGEEEQLGQQLAVQQVMEVAEETEVDNSDEETNWVTSTSDKGKDNQVSPHSGDEQMQVMNANNNDDNIKIISITTVKVVISGSAVPEPVSQMLNHHLTNIMTLLHEFITKADNLIAQRGKAHGLEESGDTDAAAAELMSDQANWLPFRAT